MDRETIPQQRQSLGASLWWSAILGLILLILNAVFYFSFPLSQFLGWGVLTSENFFLQWLQYLLLCFLGFFLISLLRRQGRWTALTPIHLTVIVVLIGILPIIAVSVVLGLVGSGLDYFADGLTLAPMIGCSEILAGVGGAQLGRLIGNRFLRR